ncbi:MAG: Tudor-knot domain-containing protein [Pirellulales bacterium]
MKRGDSDVGYATFTSSYSHNTSTGNWTFTDSLVRSFGGRPSIDYDRDSYVELNEAARYIAGEMAFVEGQMSMFTASKKFDAATKLAESQGTAGQKVDTHCQGFSEGKWYKARVLEFDAPSGQYKVHYLGWDAKYDEWLTADRVRPWQPKQFAVGTGVEACDDSGLVSCQSAQRLVRPAPRTLRQLRRNLGRMGRTRSHSCEEIAADRFQVGSDELRVVRAEQSPLATLLKFRTRHSPLRSMPRW